MKIEMEILEYVPAQGLQHTWDHNSYIHTEMQGSAFYIKMDRAGLMSLAELLLTLAQAKVPAGCHVHLDSFYGMEEGSIELIIERA